MIGYNDGFGFRPQYRALAFFRRRRTRGEFVTYITYDVRKKKHRVLLTYISCETADGSLGVALLCAIALGRSASGSGDIGLFGIK